MKHEENKNERVAENCEEGASVNTAAVDGEERQTDAINLRDSTRPSL